MLVDHQKVNVINVEKCKVLHLGKDNLRFGNGKRVKDGIIKILKSVTCEKDIVIAIKNRKF